MPRSIHRCPVRLAGIFGLAITCTGCLRAPVVELTGVRVGGIGLRGITMIAELSVDNPNRFTIATDSITFQLDASNPRESGTWTPVTSGTDRQRIRIDGRNATRVEIPIEVAYAGLSTPVRSILESGRFSYRMSGQVFVGKPLPKRVPFSQDGSLSVVAAASPLTTRETAQLIRAGIR